jgi:hypothetical protein
MTYTLEELKEYLRDHIDEVQILELLNIGSEELTDRFEDLIESKYEWLCEQLGLEDWNKDD